MKPQEDKRGLVSSTASSDVFLANGHLTYTDKAILLEGDLPPYDADQPDVTAATDEESEDFTAATDEESKDFTADLSPGAHGSSTDDAAARESCKQDGAFSSEIPMDNGVSSVDVSPQPSPPAGEDGSVAAVDSSEDTPSPENDSGQVNADIDSIETSSPFISVLPPPFLRVGGIKADLASLKVGQSLKLPERLVSRNGGAAISLGPDGSIMSSKISQTSAAPTESASQEEQQGDGATQANASEEVGDFLAYSKWRKVSGVVKKRGPSRSRAETAERIERVDKTSAEHMTEQGTGEGNTGVRGEVRGVGVGLGEGNRWWNWMGKGKARADAGGKNKTHRTEKRRFWGASGKQRREVPPPDEAKGEDVVMSITDKAVIVSEYRDLLCGRAPSIWSSAFAPKV